MTRPGNGRIVFTPERCAALKEDWQAGVSAAAIMERLNTMPSDYPVSSPAAVQDKALELGLKRPEGWALAHKKTAKPRTWTNERRELLRAQINLIPDQDLLQRLNALPGPAVRNAHAMRDRAQVFGYLAERPRKFSFHLRTWTDSRISFLRQNYGRIRPAELLAALQSMPGPEIGSIKTVKSAAVRLGIKSAGLVRQTPTPRRPALIATPEPEPEPAPLTLEEQEAAVERALIQRETRAFKMFSEGKSFTSVAQALGIPLREACRLLAAHRDHGRKAA